MGFPSLEKSVFCSPRGIQLVSLQCSPEHLGLLFFFAAGEGSLGSVLQFFPFLMDQIPLDKVGLRS